MADTGKGGDMAQGTQPGARRAAAWRAANPEAARRYRRTYREKNPGKHAAYMAEWRARNPEKVQESRDRRREANLAATRAWREANPEKAKALRTREYKKRRALKRGAVIYLRTPRDRSRQLHRQRGRCFYCDETLAPGRGTHEEHVVPLIRGGADGIGNIVYACPRCNGSKGQKTIMEWRMACIRRDRTVV